MTDAARDDRLTEAFPTEVPVPASDTERRRRRGGAGRAWIVVLVLLAVVAALLVAADLVTRDIAEAQVAQQLEQNLPEGVDGEIDVSIGGFSVIAQYLMGSMDEVALSAPRLTVDGAPVSVDVVARDVPPALDAPVGRATATLEADAAAVNRLIRIPGVQGDVVFGEGTVGYSDTIDVFGVPVDYTATARPTAAGDRVLLEPVGVEVGAGGGSIDVSALVDRLLGDEPIPVCVAEHLPDGVEVAGITVTPQHVRVELEASGIRLDEASLSRTGSCG